MEFIFNNDNKFVDKPYIFPISVSNPKGPIGTGAGLIILKLS